MRWVSTLALVSFGCCLSSRGEARPFRVAQVPNGATASCLTCHLNPGGPRNALGADIEHYGGGGFLVDGNVAWATLAVNDPAHPNQPAKTLAELDSDGDGRTNGEELLDPWGSWRIGQANPGRPELVRSPGTFADAPVVIRQIYPSGGAAGAAYQNDFVELFNRSSAPVSLSGWSLQYAPPSGLPVFGVSATTLTELPDVVLLPGQSYLVQEAASGTAGSALPSADLVDATPIELPAAGGKLALVKQPGSLGCNVFPVVCSEPQLAAIVDWVGYGTAQTHEGVAPAPTPSAAQSLSRTRGGCIDTDSNGGDATRNPPVLPDFSAVLPAVRSRASARTPCDGSNPNLTPAAAPSGAPVHGALLGLLLSVLGCCSIPARLPWATVERSGRALRARRR